MHNFRRYYERSGDARAAIRQTLETTGRALLVTSLVLAAGFFTYTGAYLSNARTFGLLAGGAILVAFLANVILASSLMMLATRREARRRGPLSFPVVQVRRGVDDTQGAMAEGIDPRGGEIEVTPEEERFLKRFFRRQLLPYFAVLLVIWVTSAWWPSEEEAGALEARTSAALAQLHTENQRLRVALAALSERMDAGLSAQDHGANELERRVEDAKRSVRMIEAQVIAATERRLDSLESQLATDAPSPARVAPSGPPPEAAAWDVSAILDRLYALEVRQEREAATWETDQRSHATQLAQLAARIAGLERDEVPLPASPAAP